MRAVLVLALGSEDTHLRVEGVHNVDQELLSPLLRMLAIVTTTTEALCNDRVTRIRAACVCTGLHTENISMCETKMQGAVGCLLVCVHCTCALACKRNEPLSLLSSSLHHLHRKTSRSVDPDEPLRLHAGRNAVRRKFLNDLNELLLVYRGMEGWGEKVFRTSTPAYSLYFSLETALHLVPSIL
jgi:hypothetical protein